MQSGPKPLVAIVGRPNVGKSTLFNRLAGRPRAIVSDVPGTTRDRVTTDTVWGDHQFILVDTGGLGGSPETPLMDEVKIQIDAAITEADVIIMVVDAHEGVTTADRDVADALRRAEKLVVVGANKADNELREAGAMDFYQLGLDDPVPISAYHNLGIDELMTRVIAHFDTQPSSPTPDADLKLAIVGRTNVGKSMLLNAITGQERAIVSEMPGTTRDSLDILMTYDDGTILLIDTAGLRRRGRIERGIEHFSALRSIRAIDRADVVVLVLDASELATSQDAHIGGYVTDSYRGLVLAVNKWDLSAKLELTEEEAVRTVRDRLKFAAHAPVSLVSALKRTGISDLLTNSRQVFDEWNKGVPRYDLRRTVLNAVGKHPPATTGRGALKIYGVAQDQTGPPSFTFYVNRANMVHFSYQRYLENALRAAYGFEGSPLRIRFKGRGDS